jgi:hypothetical protein
MTELLGQAIGKDLLTLKSLISFGINDVLFFYGCTHIDYDDRIDRFMLYLYYTRSKHSQIDSD